MPVEDSQATVSQGSFDALITVTMQGVLNQKLSDWPSAKRILVANEFIKYLRLGLTFSENHSLPGSTDMDRVWHYFILETREYQRLCAKIRPGSFFHHSGAAKDDHKSTLTKEELLEEQLTFLASYLATFGEFTDDTAPCWAVAQELMRRNGWTVAELNEFLHGLIAASS